MYVERLHVENLRSLERVELDLHYPGRRYAKGEARPRLRNMNLLLGVNGSGKTSILRALALGAIAPLAAKYVIPDRFVRLETSTLASSKSVRGSHQALSEEVWPPLTTKIKAKLRLDPQDVPSASNARGSVLTSELTIFRRGDEEEIRFTRPPDDTAWEPIYERDSPAFLTVGYGATRRVEFDPSGWSIRMRDSPPRKRRIESLFQEAYSLIPLHAWLTHYDNRGRATQVKRLLDKLLAPSGYRFTGELEGEDYLFEAGGLRLPLRALSDGYKAFIGWVADLLHHVSRGCPKGKKLDECGGLVLVDEIDLHLHPEWQLTVLETLAKTFPRLQFVFSSHSPLVTGSLEWPNVWHLRLDGQTGATRAERVQRPIHGLSADQLLTSELFGLTSTRAPAKRKEITRAAKGAERGDPAAARELMWQLAYGLEAPGPFEEG